MAPWELHPSLVHFPIAFLLGAVILDFLAWVRGWGHLDPTATGLFIVGVGTDIVAIAAGVVAFFTVPAHTEKAHVMMYWHMSLAVLALILFSLVTFFRWRRRNRSPSVLIRSVGAAAAGILIVVGYLGGQMVYHGGAGVEPELLASTLRESHRHGADGGQEPANSHSEHASHSEGKAAGRKPQGDGQPQGVAATPHQAHETKRAPEQLPRVPPPEASATQVPAGFRVEILMSDLNYPTSIEFDGDGSVYVAEAGYIYGDDVAKARILRRRTDGTTETVAENLDGPVTDLLWHDQRLYISHRGKISVLERDGVRDLVTGLPSLGDHHNNQLAVGPDGMLYFGQGTATNSGVVGLDNYKIGWLAKYPEVCDVPAKDIRLSDQAFETPNLLKLLAEQPAGDHQARQPAGSSSSAAKQSPNEEHEEHGASSNKSGHSQHGTSAQPMKEQQHAGHSAAGDPKKEKSPEGQGQKSDKSVGHAGHDTKPTADSAEHPGSQTVKTFAFQPFGKTPADDGAVRGAIKANGTILRMKPDGSNLEVFAWGLRNPFGLAWGLDDKLYASDNGYDERGGRPIAHAPDLLWEINQGAWYGFPDYAGGVPVTDAQFLPENGPAPKFLMRDHPPVEKPLVTLTHHVGAAKLAVSPNEVFGASGRLFLALSGDMNPITGTHEERSGFEVVRIDLKTGKSETFFKTKSSALGPKGMEYVATAGLKRPVDVCFSPAGDALYVVDVGAMAIVSTATGSAPRPFPGTGTVWRIVPEVNQIGVRR